MLNLIKMDFYRMIRSKSTWIILAIIGVVCLINFTDRAGMIQNVIDSRETGDVLVYTVTGQQNIPVELTLSADVLNANKEADLNDFISGLLRGKTVMFFLAIYCVLFISAERNTGYIKNIAGQINHRGKLLLSKLVVLMLYTAAAFLLVVLISIFCTKSRFGYFHPGDIGTIIKTLGVQYALHVSSCTLVMLITVLFGKGIVVMPIVVFWESTLSYSSIFISDKLLAWTLAGRIGDAGSNMSGMQMLQSISLALAYFAVFLTVSMYLIEKRDVQV